MNDCCGMARLMVLRYVSHRQGEAGARVRDLHAIDGENIAELEQLDNFTLHCDPDLRPLKWALGLGMEKDAPDAYF